MSGSDDPYTSFGKCYFDSSGTEAPGRFIPCGNVNYGNISCCQSGNMCLDSHACYDGLTGMTYVGGCTDESYSDTSCPQKGTYGGMHPPSHPTQPQPCAQTNPPSPGEAWLGYTYCNGTSNEWVGCDDNHGTATVTKTSACWCPTPTGDRIAPLAGAATLTDVVSLPSATGQKLDYKGGNAPSTDSVQNAQQTSLSSSVSESTTVKSTNINGTPTVTTATETATITSASNSSGGSDNSSSGLSSGAKAGIGVGAALIALFAAGIFLWLCVRRRRLHKNTSGLIPTPNKLEKSSATSSPETQFDSTAGAALGVGTGTGAAAAAKATHGRYYDSQTSAQAAFGHKSELDAVDNLGSTPFIPSPKTDEKGRPRSELPAGLVPGVFRNSKEEAELGGTAVGGGGSKGQSLRTSAEANRGSSVRTSAEVGNARPMVVGGDGTGWVVPGKEGEVLFEKPGRQMS